MENRETAGASKEQHETTPFRPIRMVLLLPVLVAAGLLAWWCRNAPPARAEFAAEAATLPNGLVRLERTVVVPTLDTPCPRGENIIWCSSFQLTWNEIRDNVVGAPLQVIGAEKIADRLNAGKESISDLDAESVYAAGGWIGQGIRERIRKDMAARFPSHTLPDFNDFIMGILAYSYLTARVPFKHPFRQVDKGITFTDSQGAQSQVAGFGLLQAHLPAYQEIREQVAVLYAQSKSRDHSAEMTEYALDLCRYSIPYQVVVARVELQSSLAQTLERVRTGIADFEKNPRHQEERQFAEADWLKVPEMFWRIDHRFKELIDKVVANTNPPMPIVEALQTIEFRLDRCGATLESEALLAIASRPRQFDFNRPFLVYMQKRGAERPFFVMWVDNAELLTRK